MNDAPSNSYIWAPYREAGPTPPGMVHKCNGTAQPFPWDYRITAVIPVIDTFEMLEYCVRLLRSQFERPFIQVVDTGSRPDEWDRISRLQAHDLEIVSLRLNGYRHRSDPVAMAMDCAFATVRTPYLFATHADVFLKRRDFLGDVLELCRRHPVVGYRLSPRQHQGWEEMVGHTATLFDMRALSKLKIRWSLADWYERHGYEVYDPAKTFRNVPDTEFNLNEILRENGIKPHFIGCDQDEKLMSDHNLWHLKSSTLVKLYTDPDRPRSILRGEWWNEVKLQCDLLLEQWGASVK